MLRWNATLAKRKNQIFIISLRRQKHNKKLLERKLLSNLLSHLHLLLVVQARNFFNASFALLQYTLNAMVPVPFSKKASIRPI
jgi:hypothetical protein